MGPVLPVGVQYEVDEGVASGLRQGLAPILGGVGFEGVDEGFGMEGADGAGDVSTPEQVEPVRQMLLALSSDELIQAGVFVGVGAPPVPQPFPSTPAIECSPLVRAQAAALAIATIRAAATVACSTAVTTARVCSAISSRDKPARSTAASSVWRRPAAMSTARSTANGPVGAGCSAVETMTPS